MAEVADGVSTPNAHSTAQPDVPTPEGAGNKFQNAISAWRSACALMHLQCRRVETR